jgi:CO dehydrogenase/acetyl-CoA synthase gamma subunit (corrinoid Fe-S protein)
MQFMNCRKTNKDSGSAFATKNSEGGTSSCPDLKEEEEEEEEEEAKKKNGLPILSSGQSTPH